MIAVGVEITGLEAVTATIGAREERIADLGPAFAIVADLLEAHVAAQFATQGGRSGSPWLPLAPSTVEARTRRWGHYRYSPTGGAGPAGPPLTWTGRLRDSFRQGYPDHVREVGPDGLTWGSLVDYGAFHQAGRVVPRRPMLEFRDEFQREETTLRSLRLWLQGVPADAIRGTMAARLGLPV